METAKGKSREEIINRLAARIDSFENYIQPHAHLMADLATHLSRRLGLAQPDINAITEAALLHDIGLYAMTPGYHATPGPLTFEERMDLWRHPIIGEQQMAKRDGMRHAQLLVRWHHEWWNGSGYPDMLAFEDIPIGARILRAVELFSALISDRPYRAALNRDQAIETLKASAGIECDPYIIKALAALLEDIHAQAGHRESPLTADIPANAEEPGSRRQDVPPQASSSSQSDESLAQDALASSGVQGESSHSSYTSEPLKSAPDATFQAAQPYTGEYSESSSSDTPEIEGGVPSNEAPNEVAQETVEQREMNDSAPAIPEAQNLESLNPASLNPASAESQEPGPESRPPAVESAARHPAPTSGTDNLRRQMKDFVEDEPPRWQEWTASRYNKKSLLGFEASVLRQIEFRSIAIPFSSLSRLDWYLKAWGKLILANDPRAWAGTAARAMVEAKEPLGEDQIMRVLEDVYVPGARLMNPELRHWFGETDAWWMDNLRRNIDALEDETLRAQAIVLGMKTGDYALSFDDETRELRRPLTTVYWRLAGRAFIGPAGHPHSRGYNMPAENFLKRSRADLVYMSLPVAHAQEAGAEARSEWRESWVRQSADIEGKDAIRQMTAPQSKQAYLALIDRLLRSALHIRTWAIGYQEIGLAAASDIVELIKEYRPVRATYSKDLTEVAGGLRSFIIIADKATA